VFPRLRPWDRAGSRSRAAYLPSSGAGR
jgi:hypothetical protein